VRVVLDANIWVSALQFGGTPLRVVAHALEHNTIVCCSWIEQEIAVTLDEKFGRAQEETYSLLRDYLSSHLNVSFTPSLQGACRDPKDDVVLECALLGDADLLVSGDRDLLTLGNFRTIRILTARAYMELTT
jgi:putative PIN family toxin of toxin-antitoxin system